MKVPVIKQSYSMLSTPRTQSYNMILAPWRRTYSMVLTPRIMLHILQFGLLFNVAYSTIALNIHPMDPYIEDGKVVELWCSVNDTQNKYQSSDLCFQMWTRYDENNSSFCLSSPRRRCQRCIAASKKRVLNRTTVQIGFRVNRRLDRAIVICTTWDRTNESREAQLNVGRRPARPKIDTFRLNNWNSLDFSWRVPKSLKFTTEYTASYRLGRNAQFKLCGTCKPEWNKKLTCNKCSISIDDYANTPNVSIKVNASNPFGHVHVVENFHDILQYNLPYPVRVARWELGNETDRNGLYTMQIFLIPSRTDQRLRYRTSIRCDEDTRDFTDDQTIQRITLPAFSSCLITVQCQSVTADGVGTGYWSENVDFINITTPQTVPVSSVRTCANCFEVSSVAEAAESSIRHVTVYFQQLSKREARGNVKSYKIRYWTTEHSSSHKSTSVTAHTNQVSLQLNKDFTYDVTIEAETDVGLNTTLAATRVRIPKHFEVPLPPSNVTAIALNSSAVRVSWPASEGVSKFTVLWCQSHALFHDICQYHIEWIELAPTYTDWTVELSDSTLDNEKLYKFGVALMDIDGHGSDITWVKCINSIKHRASRPSHVSVFNFTSSSVTLNIESPSCKSWESGFVYSYRITYNQCGGICDTTTAGTATVEVLTSHSMFTIHDLDSGSTYQFVVHSVTLAGLSDVGVIINATTVSHALPSSSQIALTTAGFLILIIPMIFGIIGIFMFLKYLYQSCTEFNSLQITPPVNQGPCIVDSGGFTMDYTQSSETPPILFKITPPKIYFADKLVSRILPPSSDCDAESSSSEEFDIHNNNATDSNVEVCDPCCRMESTVQPEFDYTPGFDGRSNWHLSCQGRPKSFNQENNVA